MKKKTNVLFYFIPVIYLVVIGLLLFLQFKPIGVESSVKETSKSELIASKTEDKETPKVKSENTKKAKFSKKVGDIVVSSKKKVKFDKSSADADSALVAYENLIFKFESKKDILLKDPKGKESAIALDKILFNKSEVILKCKNDIDIVFATNEDKTVSIYANSKKASGILYVNLAVANKASLFSETQSSTIISVGKKQSSILVQSANKQNDIVLTLPIVSGEAKECGARLLTVSNADIWGGIVEMHQKQDFETSLAAIRNGFYKGWREGRWVAADKKWMMADGSLGVNPELVSGLFTESYLRNRTEDMLTFLNEAGVYSYSIVNGQKYNMTVLPQAEDITTALIFGNMKKNWNNYQQFSKNELFKFSNAVNSNNFKIFENNDLVSQIVLFGAANDKQKFETLAKAAFKEALLPELAKALILSKQYIEIADASESFVKEMKLGADRLAKSVSFGAKGVWIAEDDVVDVEATVIAALALHYQGITDGNTYFKKVSASLISSVAPLVDSQGFLPKNVSFLNNSIIGKQKIATEDLYLWMKELNYQPKLVKVQQPNKENFYVLHRAEKLTATLGENKVDLQFKRWHRPGSYLYPVGVLNNFYIAKLEGYQKIGMMNSPSWPGDRTFESWRVGYYYWQGEGLLTAMLRHRSQYELFTIQW